VGHGGAARPRPEEVARQPGHGGGVGRADGGAGGEVAGRAVRAGGGGGRAPAVAGQVADVLLHELRPGLGDLGGGPRRGQEEQAGLVGAGGVPVVDEPDDLGQRPDALGEELLLGGEVVVAGPGAHPALLGHLGHRRPGQALAGEDPDAGVDDLVDPRRPVGGPSLRSSVHRTPAVGQYGRSDVTSSPASGGSSVISEPTTARRPAHRPSRRDDVLAAGTVEFVERGFSSVSVTDIAKRAGMTPAAVYYHFPTKEDVLLALVGRTGDAIAELCAEAVEADAAPDAVTALIDRFLAWLEVHGADARLYYQSSQGATADVEALRREQRRRQVTAMLNGPLRAARGSMSATEQRVVAIALLVLFGEVTRLLSEGRPTRRHRDEVRAEAVDLGRRLARA